MDFGCITDGGSIDLLCKMKIFDISHGKHVLVTEPNGISFVYTGLLEYGHEAYTLLDAELVRQFPEPHVRASRFTRVINCTTSLMYARASEVWPRELMPPVSL